MALNSGKILMRRGQEVNFDPNKMTPGEWAVSLDSKYVRMCFSPGVCVRMATYDAFEADMVQMQRILEECQTIEEAVNRINDEVSVKAQAVAEYAAQAKQYRDEAEQFRNEAFSSTPEGYLDLVEQVGENTRKIAEGVGGVSSYNDLENKPKINDVVLDGEKTLEELGIASKDALEKTDNKVNIIIEQAELRFKETASGENIHLDDSADSKFVEFSLYGKAVQNTTSGKQLIPYPYQQGSSGIVTVLENGGIKISGTTTNDVWFAILNSASNINPYYLPSGTYTLSVEATAPMDYVHIGVINVSDGSTIVSRALSGLITEVTFTIDSETNISIRIFVGAGRTVNTTIYPMLRLASITDSTWEPYTGGIPSPNPEYPQEIEVSGESGSVEVKSVGKNLIPYPYFYTTRSENGVNWVDNGDGTITVNGFPTKTTYFGLYNNEKNIEECIFKPNTKYILSYELKNATAVSIYVNVNNKDLVTIVNKSDGYYEMEFTTPESYNTRFAVALYVYNIEEINCIVKPMIRLATDTDNTWEPYKGKTATIPTPNGLAGIPVDSGGNYTDQNGQQWICDEIVKYSDGSGEYVQRISKRIIDGVNNKCTYVNPSLAGKTETLVQINFGVNAEWTDSYLPQLKVLLNRGIFFIYGGASSCFRYGLRRDPSTGACCYYIGTDEGVTDIATANTWLQNNPVTLYYAINPIRTPLTSEQLTEIEKPSTFYPVTNISNDADCGMKVKYIADAKSYIDNRLALIEQAMLNSI